MNCDEREQGYKKEKKSYQISKKYKTKEENVPARQNLKKQKVEKIKKQDIKRIMRNYC